MWPPNNPLNFISKGPTHMMNIVSEIRDVPLEVLLCTVDISSLYLNIPHEEGVTAINEMLVMLRSLHDLI